MKKDFDKRLMSASERNPFPNYIFTKEKFLK